MLGSGLREFILGMWSIGSYILTGMVSLGLGLLFGYLKGLSNGWQRGHDWVLRRHERAQYDRYRKRFGLRTPRPGGMRKHDTHDHEWPDV